MIYARCWGSTVETSPIGLLEYSPSPGLWYWFSDLLTHDIKFTVIYQVGDSDHRKSLWPFGGFVGFNALFNIWDTFCSSSESNCISYSFGFPG